MCTGSNKYLTQTYSRQTGGELSAAQQMRYKNNSRPIVMALQRPPPSVSTTPVSAPMSTDAPRFIPAALRHYFDTPVANTLVMPSAGDDSSSSAPAPAITDESTSSGVFARLLPRVLLPPDCNGSADVPRWPATSSQPSLMEVAAHLANHSLPDPSLLSPNAYAGHFSSLLAAEVASNQAEVATYDVHNVAFTAEPLQVLNHSNGLSSTALISVDPAGGQSITLSVPGIREGAPSLELGSTARLRIVADASMPLSLEVEAAVQAFSTTQGTVSLTIPSRGVTACCSLCEMQSRGTLGPESKAFLDTWDDWLRSNASLPTADREQNVFTPLRVNRAVYPSFVQFLLLAGPPLSGFHALMSHAVFFGNSNSQPFGNTQFTAYPFPIANSYPAMPAETASALWEARKSDASLYSLWSAAESEARLGTATRPPTFCALPCGHQTLCGVHAALLRSLRFTDIAVTGSASWPFSRALCRLCAAHSRIWGVALASDCVTPHPTGRRTSPPSAAADNSPVEVELLSRRYPIESIGDISRQCGGGFANFMIAWPCACVSTSSRQFQTTLRDTLLRNKWHLRFECSFSSLPRMRSLLGTVQEAAAAAGQQQSGAIMSRLFPTVDTIARRVPALRALRFPLLDTRLNATQKRAVTQIVSRSSASLDGSECCSSAPTLLIGPAGTGKTSTLAEGILQLLLAIRCRDAVLRQNLHFDPTICAEIAAAVAAPTTDSTRTRRRSHSRVLVVAPSNEAADVVLKSLVGPQSSSQRAISNVLQALGLVPFSSTQRSASSSSSSILSFNLTSRLPDSQALDLRQYSSMETLPTGSQRFRLPSRPDLERAALVFCTALGAGVYGDILRSECGEGAYRCSPGCVGLAALLFDECTQALEPEALIPLSLACACTTVVLSGDPFQLGPLIRSHLASERGLGVSLLERLLRGGSVHDDSGSGAGGAATAASAASSPAALESIVAGVLSKRPSHVGRTSDATITTPEAAAAVATVSFYDTIEAAESGLSATLTCNYRAHPLLLHLPSQLFYGNTLVSASDLKNPAFSACASFSLLPRLPSGTAGQFDTVPLLCIGVEGSDQHEVDVYSYWNNAEANAVVWTLRYLLSECESSPPVFPFAAQVWVPSSASSHTSAGSVDSAAGVIRSLPVKNARIFPRTCNGDYVDVVRPEPMCLTQFDIGVIAPYRQQVLTLRKALREAGLRDVSVGSVANFQGAEKKVIVLSTVLSKKYGAAAVRSAYGDALHRNAGMYPLSVRSETVVAAPAGGSSQAVAPSQSVVNGSSAVSPSNDTSTILLSSSSSSGGIGGNGSSRGSSALLSSVSPAAALLQPKSVGRGSRPSTVAVHRIAISASDHAPVSAATTVSATTSVSAATAPESSVAPSSPPSAVSERTPRSPPTDASPPRSNRVAGTEAADGSPSSPAVVKSAEDDTGNNAARRGRVDSRQFLGRGFGLFGNPKAFNVAVTRAQSCLIVVGDPSVFARDPLWATFLRHALSYNAYLGWNGLKPPPLQYNNDSSLFSSSSSTSSPSSPSIPSTPLTPVSNDASAPVDQLRAVTTVFETTMDTYNRFREVEGPGRLQQY